MDEQVQEDRAIHALVRESVPTRDELTAVMVSYFKHTAPRWPGYWERRYFGDHADRLFPTILGRI